jgi:hypothetical protein
MFFSTAVVLSVLAFRTGRQTIVVIIKCYLLTAISAAIVAFSRFFAALGHDDVVSSIDGLWIMESLLKHYRCEW